MLVLSNPNQSDIDQSIIISHASKIHSVGDTQTEPVNFTGSNGESSLKRIRPKAMDLTLEERHFTSSSSSSSSSLLSPALSSPSSDHTVGPNVPTIYTSSSSVSISDDRNKDARDSPPPQDLLPAGDTHRRDTPKLTLNTTMIIDNDNVNSTINTASSQQPFFPPVSRRTASAAPRLSLPPANYRFSVNLVDGHAARLSPTVILRPPPLPLLNLPVLPDSTDTTTSLHAGSVSDRRSKRAGLMSMPALPRHGSSKGTAGHEELDDVEDEDEDEEDEDAEDDDDDADADDNIGPDSASSAEDIPQSGSSSDAETTPSSPSHSRSPSGSSYETVHVEPSIPHEGYFGNLTGSLQRRFSKIPYLPPMAMSPIDLSFLDSPPSRGKARNLTEDAGRTPIRPNWNSATARNSTPTSFRRMDLFIPEGTKIGTWAASPKGGQPSSPAQTPRPGGHFNLPLPVLVPPSPSLTPIRPTIENRRLSMLSITQFPGTYKRASTSLIDIHALEKKEKVEQMVKEEEESAEEEERKRIKAMRRSMRIDATSTNGDDEESKSPLRSTRMSLGSRPADGNVDDGDVPLEDLPEASSPIIKNKINNRISMAPAYETIIPLRRRLSMPTFSSTLTAPPPYPDLFPGQASAHTYGVRSTQIQPRDDEGRETLPAYSNSIYLRAVMPRKLEFSRPGVQAKDRKWKRVLCVLEGTSFKVYKPPGVSGIEGWWESRVGIGNKAMSPTTTSSFNSEGGRRRVHSGSAGGKVELESRVREGMVATPPVPSQSNNTYRRQGPDPTTNGNSHTPAHAPVLSTKKSALNLAVHLLIPSSRGHGRTISDVGQPSNTPPVPRLPRPSLNISRDGRSTPTPTIASTNTGTSSSRPPSPTFASSSSSLTIPESSSSSHSSMGGSATSSGILANNYSAAAASTSSLSKGKKREEDPDLLPDETRLIKAYTMQLAESGLGSDYLKRKHVIRVRLEGEQFLLQAKDVDSVIEWIEVSLCPFVGGSFFVGYLLGADISHRGYRLQRILRWTWMNELCLEVRSFHGMLCFLFSCL